MRGKRESRFRQIESFFIDLALLILLLIGLWRVVSPDLQQVIRELSQIGKPEAGEPLKGEPARAVSPFILPARK